jgi:hypothetical protein
MCQLDDEERCAVWSETPHKARKEHLCSTCDATIPKGAVYIRHFSLYDGHCSTAKVCGPCNEIRTAFGREHAYYPHPDTTLEYLDQCVQDARDEREGWKQPLKWARAARSIRRRASQQEQR